MGYGACLWLQELIALDAKFYPSRVTWQIALPPEVEPRPSYSQLLSLITLGASYYQFLKNFQPYYLLESVVVEIS